MHRTCGGKMQVSSFKTDENEINSKSKRMQKCLKRENSDCGVFRSPLCVLQWVFFWVFFLVLKLCVGEKVIQRRYVNRSETKCCFVGVILEKKIALIRKYSTVVSPRTKVGFGSDGISSPLFVFFLSWNPSLVLRSQVFSSFSLFFNDFYILRIILMHKMHFTFC